MPTLGQLKATISDDLARSDLTPQIAGAIADSIRVYETERLWFNTSRNITFATIADQIAYGATANPFIPNLLHIDAVKFHQGQTPIYDLDNYYPEDFDDLGNASSGRPTCYTYALDDADSEMQLRLWPTPNAAYTIRLHATYRLPALGSDNESNAWTTEAHELIRTAAKLRIYFHITQDPEQAMLMRVGAEALLNSLRLATSQRTGRGRIQPTEF
jgi:hypothetical protein